MDVVAFHLVRLSDGKLCDRVVFREDYARLRRGAAVSAYRVSADEELLAVLSLRWQSLPPAPRAQNASYRRRRRRRRIRRRRERRRLGGVGLGVGVGVGEFGSLRPRADARGRGVRPGRR